MNILAPVTMPLCAMYSVVGKKQMKAHHQLPGERGPDNGNFPGRQSPDATNGTTIIQERQFA